MLPNTKTGRQARATANKINKQVIGRSAKRAHRVCFTVFEQPGSRLSKEYTPNPDGTVARNGGTRLYDGTYSVKQFDGTDPATALAEIGRLLEGLPASMTIGLGVPRDGSTAGKITTKTRFKQGRTDALARALMHFGWPDGPGLLLLDGDDINDLCEVLVELYPPFAEVAMLMRPSASASVLDPQTGKPLKQGEHIYVVLDEPSQSADCLKAIMRLAWCCGKGRSAGRLDPAADGHVLVHGPVDITVGSPERPSYEGANTLRGGLTALPRQARVCGGTGVLCASALLSYADQHAPREAYQALITAALKDPVFLARQAQARARYRAEQIDIAVARGIPRVDAEKEFNRIARERNGRSGGGNGSDVPFDERDWQELSLHQVLYRPSGEAFLASDMVKDPKAFHNTECADPIEGLNYQTNNCGWIVIGGRIEIYSRAHGDSRAFFVCLFDPADFAARLADFTRKWHEMYDDVETFFSNGVRTSAAIAEVMRLAGLAWIDYEQQRKAAAATLEIRVGQLDRMVEIARRQRQQQQAGDTNDEIARFNVDHALVLAGKKAAVMRFENDREFRLLEVQSFKLWHANQSVMVGRTPIPLGDYWLSHPQRRQYSGIEFAPPGTALSPSFYNLWQGFAVVPFGDGDCSKFLAHIKDNVARGDEKTFDWIIGWWAQIFQQPSVKMETALVLRGPFGAGKTKIGDVMGSLLGRHFVRAASQRYITGQFNSHMASLLVLHADEAFWAGDKTAVGTLNDLVSGKMHQLEYKGIDPITIKNFIRLFVTGNPDWMVPAGFKERRWAVLDMGEDHMQDHAYFAAIDHEMDHGGREALLHHLLNFDLAKVDLRTIPKTAALLDQQIASMNSEEAWWLDLLRDGKLPRPHGCAEENVCACDGLHGWYVEHAQRQGVSFRSSQTKLGMFLKKQLGDSLQNFRPQVRKERPHCYRLPPLQVCRECFAKKLGQTIDWGAGGKSEVWAYQDWRV